MSAEQQAMEYNADVMSMLQNEGIDDTMNVVV